MKKRAPATVPSNQWPTLVGDNEVSAVNPFVGDFADSYLQSTATTQEVELGFSQTEVEESVPEGTILDTVLVTVRVEAVGAGSGSVRVEMLSEQTTNTLSFATRTIVEADGLQEFTFNFPFQELASGDFAHWTSEALAVATVKITDEGDPSTRLKLYSVQVHYEHALEQNVALDLDLSQDPAAFGFTDEGGVAYAEVNGLHRINDTSAVAGGLFRRLEEFDSTHGIDSVHGRINAAWSTLDGVFAANLLTINAGGKFIQVNLINSGGQDQIGLLAGDTDSFDPKLIGSYAATANYEWQTVGKLFSVRVVRDDTNISVFTDEDFVSGTPSIQVPIGSVGSGFPANYVEYGTEVTGTSVVASEGDISFGRLLSNFTQESGLDTTVVDHQGSSFVTRSTVKPNVALIWHSNVDFDQYRVRFGGTSHDTGFFISSINGSINTEGSGVVTAGTQVTTVLEAEDLFLIRPDDREGSADIYIYVRDNASKQWILQSEAARVDVEYYKLVPEITAPEFIGDFSTTIRLSASRQFSVVDLNNLPVLPEQHTAVLTFNLDTGIARSVDVSPEENFVPAFDGTFTLNFGLVNVVSLEGTGIAAVTFTITDQFGHTELVQVPMRVRPATAFEGSRGDSGFREALPYITKNRDPVLRNQFLPPFDFVLYQLREISKKLATLIDVNTAPSVPGEPEDALQLMFEEMGLIYPAVPGYSEAALRRLLEKADEVHRSRFTLDGLEFYLGLLIPNATVTITGVAPGGQFFFCNTTQFGFSDETLLDSIGTDQDINNYLIGPHNFSTITITITGTVSAEMQEFVETTIRREIPMADDPVNPREIVIIFVP